MLLSSFLQMLYKTFMILSIYTNDPRGFTKIPRITFRCQKAITTPIITRRAIDDVTELECDMFSVSMNLISSPKDVSERINKAKIRGGQ